jgi:hypothetical protein
METAGFVNVEFAPHVDTFGGAPGEGKARAFGTFGVSIRGRRPRS